MAPLDRSHTSSYWCSIVTTARSCIISDNLVENCDFSHTPAAFDPVLWTSPLQYCRKVWYGKTRMVWLPDGEKFDNTLSSFDIIPVPICDRQTSCHSIVRAMHTHCVVKTEQVSRPVINTVHPHYYLIMQSWKQARRTHTGHPAVLG